MREWHRQGKIVIVISIITTSVVYVMPRVLKLSNLHLLLVFTFPPEYSIYS